MTEYAVEQWKEVKGEMPALWDRHWKEVALNHAEVPLDVDHERYDALADAGVLHVVTARRDGVLIGYHIAIISTHLHYKSTKHGITDVYYIAPEYRHGIAAVRLFQRVEKELKAAGVRKLFTGVKLHIDNGPLFEHLGYKPVERLYSKII